jgi:hypothetical protein
MIDGKLRTTPEGNEYMKTPSYEEYRAAGHDHATAQALVGIDGTCEVHRRVNVMRRALTHWHVPTVARPRESHGSTNGRVRGSRRTNSSRPNAPPSSDDPSDPEPPERRLCQHRLCQADITHLRPVSGPRPDFCDRACKQAAYRDRQTIKLLDERSGTIVEGLGCVCDPQRNVLEPGHCHQCGKPRGVITCGWLKDEGVPARSFVTAPGDTRHVRNHRKRAARLSAENTRKRKTREYRWDEPAAREEVAA